MASIGEQNDKGVIRHISKISLHLFGAVFGVVVLALIALGLRLSMGPISIGFLTPVLEAALTEQLDGLTPSISDTVIAWNGIDRDLVLEVVGFDLRDDQARLIARLPRADLRLDPRALLRGHLVPGRVVLRDAGIRLTRRSDGGLEIGFGGSIAVSTPSNAANRAPFDAIAAIERLVFSPKGALAGLDLLRAENTALVFDDQATGRLWSSHDLNVSFRRDPAVPVLRVSGSLTSAGETLRLDLNTTFHPENRSATLALDFDNWTPALFDVGGRFMGAVGGIIMPLSGHADLVIDAESGPRWARLTVKAGAGGLDLPDLFPAGLRLGGGSLDLEVDLRAKTARLHDLSIDIGSGTLSGQGRLSFDTPGVGLDLDLAIDHLAVDRLHALWPVTMAVNGWRWIKQNMTGGAVSDARFTLHIAPGMLEGTLSPDVLKGSFKVDGVTVNYLDGLTPAAGVSGTATLDANHITADVQTGQVDMGPAGRLILKAGQVTIGDLMKPDQYADITIDVNADARAAMTLLDRAPLGYAKKIGIDPAGISGAVTSSTHFHFPLLADLGLDRLEISHQASLKAITITNAALGLDLTNGTMNLTLDQKGAKGQGQAHLGPAPVTLNWHQDFVPKPGAVSTVLGVQTVINPALLARFGWVPGARLKGTFPVAITLSGSANTIGRIAIDADLTPAVSDIPELGWSKAAGQAARLVVDVLPKPSGGYHLDGLSLTAPDLALDGGLDVGSDGTILSGAFSRLRFGKTDVALRASRVAAGAPLNVLVTGSQIDLTDYLALPSAARRPEAERPDPAAVDGLPDFNLNAAVDRVSLDKQLSASQLRGHVLHVGGLWRAAELTAKVGGDAAMRAVLASTDTGRRFSLTSSGEAGALVRILGLYEGAVGGTLALTGQIDDTKLRRPMDAHVEMRDFKLQGTPVLARLLTLGSLSGIVDALNGEGVSFSAVQADLHQDDWVIRVDRGKAFGDSIGASFSGTYDLWGRSVSLGGTIVPSYAFNQFIGQIPLLGTLLTGGEGGGLFAFTYSITGAIEKPDISVNALSGLAPGILRDIVSAIDGSDAAATAKAPPLVPPVPPAGAGAVGNAAPATKAPVIAPRIEHK